MATQPRQSEKTHDYDHVVVALGAKHLSDQRDDAREDDQQNRRQRHEVDVGRDGKLECLIHESCPSEDL